jgi:glycosyltransferase involved in cell wall biosynthesis
MTTNGVSANGDLRSTPLVSAIVCNYNYARYLGRTIDSLAAQTHRPIELTLVDDASRDDSKALIASLPNRHRGRFAAVNTLFRARNSGKLACLNMALDHVAGDLAVVLDADDLLSPAFLERSIEELRAQRRRDRSIGFVYTDCTLIDSEGHALGTGRSVPWDRDLLERSSYIPDCGLTLSAALRGAAPFDESIRVGSKHHKWLRVSAAGWSGRHLAHPLFSYRLHDANVSGIGSRLLPELNASPAPDRLLARVWPTAIPSGSGAQAGVNETPSRRSSSIASA